MGKKLCKFRILLAEISEGFILEIIFNLEVKNHSHKEELMKSERDSSLKERVACVSLKRFEAV